MKIILFNNRYYPGLGGSETLVKNQAEELIKRGHKVIVITSNFQHSSGFKKVNKKEEMINGVRVIRLESIRLLGRDALTLIPIPRNILEIINDSDILHIYTHGYWTSWWPVVLRKLGLISNEIKLVYSPHYAPSKNYSSLLVSLYDLTLGKFVIKNVDHIILLTGAYKELFLSKGVRNISVIPPFIRYPEEISSAEKKDIREKYKIGEDKIWVFSISRIIRHKGIQFFINALPGILDKHSSVRFMVAGGGDYIGKLKEYVEVLDLKDRVKFLGRVSEREKEVLYRLSDVFTLLSFSSESFGITLAEAMQAGLPILASNKGAVPYVVKDGRNGVIVDPFDKKQIIEGFSAVLENKEKYSTQNIEDSKQYTPEVVISKIEKVYEEVINED